MKNYIAAIVALCLGALVAAQACATPPTPAAFMGVADIAQFDTAPSATLPPTTAPVGASFSGVSMDAVVAHVEDLDKRVTALEEGAKFSTAPPPAQAPVQAVVYTSHTAYAAPRQGLFRGGLFARRAERRASGGLFRGRGGPVRAIFARRSLAGDC